MIDERTLDATLRLPIKRLQLGLRALVFALDLVDSPLHQVEVMRIAPVARVAVRFFAGAEMLDLFARVADFGKTQGGG